MKKALSILLVLAGYVASAQTVYTKDGVPLGNGAKQRSKQGEVVDELVYVGSIHAMKRQPKAVRCAD